VTDLAPGEREQGGHDRRRGDEVSREAAGEVGDGEGGGREEQPLASPARARARRQVPAAGEHEAGEHVLAQEYKGSSTIRTRGRRSDK
jgi:hypothetical protein